MFVFLVESLARSDQQLLIRRSILCTSPNDVPMVTLKPVSQPATCFCTSLSAIWTSRGAYPAIDPALQYYVWQLIIRQKLRYFAT